MTLLGSVEDTLDALDLDDQDKAAAELARLYARHIDGAAAASARADKALRLVEGEGDEVLIEMVQALKARVNEGTTLDRLGARLQTALVELQATPKSRGGKIVQSVTGPSPLAGLRLAGSAS